MNDDPQRLMNLFNDALARRDKEERAAFLAAECGDDTHLRQQVESLLDSHENIGGFLLQPVALPGDESPGADIGRYRLLDEIGEGTFGRVFRAGQTTPMQRLVALKVIKAGMDTREVVARFEAERQALALMDHPHIAKVLDAGTTETGRPYFVMELVDGLPVTDFCDQHRLPTEARLALFTKICLAVQHAHQKGIIHRDLKPSNILVSRSNGEPEPKIIDFGVAKALGTLKLTERTLLTIAREIIGTPAYMSPEQADSFDGDIDTRTDIYSLGVLLYELLTGMPPFDGSTLHLAPAAEIRRVIREADPPKPSTCLRTLGQQAADIASRRSTDPALLYRSLHGDLDWIVMRSIEKDRRFRYQTMSALVEDIHRHLTDQPVSAGPPSTCYRLHKFIRRHRVGTAVTAAGIAAVLVGIASLAIGLIQAGQERDRAIAAERRAEQERDRAETLRKLATARLEVSEQQQVILGTVLRMAEVPYHFVGTTWGPDGNLYLCCKEDQSILRFHGKTGALIDDFIKPNAGGLVSPEGLLFGPDANGDAANDLYVICAGSASVLRYDGRSGEFIDTFVSPGDGGLIEPTGLTFGPDQNLYLADPYKHRVLQYDGSSGKFIKEFVKPQSGGVLLPRTPAFGPDRRLYVVGRWGDGVFCFDGETGEFVDRWTALTWPGLKAPKSMVIGNDGKIYVGSGRDGVVIIQPGLRDPVDTFLPQGAGAYIDAHALTIGPDRDFYVTNYVPANVLQYDGETGEFKRVLVDGRQAAAELTKMRLARTLAGETATSPGAARAQLRIGYIFKGIQNERSAREWVERAVAHYESLILAEGSTFGLAHELAGAHFHLGTILERSGDRGGSMPHYRRAMEVWSEQWPCFQPAPLRVYAIRLLTCNDSSLCGIRNTKLAIRLYCVSHKYRTSVNYPLSLMLGQILIEVGDILGQEGNLATMLAQCSDAMKSSNGLERELYRLAVAYLEANDGEEWRSAMQVFFPKQSRLMRLVGAFPDRWLEVLDGGQLGRQLAFLRAAEEATVTDTARDVSLPEAQVIGAFLYRAHRYEDAIRFLHHGQMVSSSAKEFWGSPAYGAYFLAMAHARLGHRMEAWLWFDNGRKLQHPLSGADASGGLTTSGPQSFRAAMDLLRAEAESLLGTLVPR